MRNETFPDDFSRVQQDLRNSEAHRQALLDSALDCIICADAQAKITEFNVAASKTFRVTRAQVLGKDLVQAILHPAVQDRIRRDFFTHPMLFSADIVGSRLETKCLRADNSEFAAEVTVTQTLADKELSYTVYVRDITARQRAEETVMRLAAIVESSQDAIISKDLTCRITSWNKGAELMFGYSAEDAIGQDIAMLAPAGRSREMQRIVDELKGGHLIKNFETVRMAKSGKVIYVSLTVSPVLDSNGGVIGASSIARDITAPKLAEEALRRANETSVYASPVPIIAADKHSQVTMWNPAAEALFGWSEEELVGKPVPIIPSGEKTAAAELHARLLEGEIVRGVDVLRQTRDGSILAIKMSAAPIRDENRKVKGIIGFLTNITDLQRSETALRQAEQKYRAIFENAAEGIYQSSLDGQYIAANPALARMLGFDSPEELISSRTDISAQRYVSRDIHAEFVRAMTQYGAVQNFEYEAFRKDGKIILVSENARVVRDSAGKILYFEGTVEDITRQRELEHQLRQMQKIEAVGRLAGGVAHDFNNILMAISSYAELLERKLTDPSTGRYVSEIVKATKRGSSLTDGLLTFSRKQVLSPKVLDLNALIAEHLKMLSRLIPENIELKFAAGGDLGHVKADPSQVQQVLMNLIINARDAMANGGRLLLQTTNAKLDSASSPHNQDAAARYVLVSVTDTGCGMDSETMSHIFEPFFTTKEQGKGTGLGLAIVFGIVKQSGGHVSVQSEPGKGTTFKVYFPMVEAAIERENAEVIKHLGTGTETILLVEDEDGVRNSTAEYLRDTGYTVLTAAGGPEALQIVEQYDRPIHLLLTDVIMPFMSGRELAEVMTSHRPETRVVFMSGYSDNLLSTHQIINTNHRLLRKPFSLESLGQCIREVLEDSGHKTAASSS
jgi:two-component system, cell cycle sensor histidine kinase and response regulator CckA